MTDSEILQALNDCEILMAGKGYPTARMAISCERTTRWTPHRPWTVSLYRYDAQFVSEADFLGSFGDALTAILALSNAVEDVEPRPRDWTPEEVAATLGIAPDYAEAAE